MDYKMYIFIFQLTCGLKNINAMIGHNIRPAQENEFPSVVCIARYNPLLRWQDNIACTGTLISQNFILTASHCLDSANNAKYEISIGSHFIEQGERYYPIWWITYDQWATEHVSNHVASPRVNDVLLLKIVGIWRDIPLNRLKPMTPATSMYGLNFTIVGCGRLENGSFPSILQVATVKVINMKKCNKKMTELQGELIRLTDKFSCSIGDPYTQVAIGDSGGPLMYKGGIVGITIAVCPRMDNVFHADKANIHANINRYEEFLRQLATEPTQSSNSNKSSKSITIKS